MPSSAANSRRSSRSGSSTGCGSVTVRGDSRTVSPSRFTTCSSPASVAPRRKPTSSGSSPTTARSRSADCQASSGHTRASRPVGTGRDDTIQESTCVTHAAACRSSHSANRRSRSTSGWSLRARGSDFNCRPAARPDVARAATRPSTRATSYPSPADSQPTSPRLPRQFRQKKAQFSRVDPGASATTCGTLAAITDNRFPGPAEGVVPAGRRPVGSGRRSVSAGVRQAVGRRAERSGTSQVPRPPQVSLRGRRRSGRARSRRRR